MTAAVASDLVTAYGTRYDDHMRKQLSRQNDPANATSVDSDKETAAANDTLGRFLAETGIELQSDVQAHMTVGVDMMEFFLLKRARARQQAYALWDQDCKPELERLRKMRARAVSLDANTENWEPETPARTQEPDFDEHGSFWDGVLPGRNKSRTDALDETHPF